MNIVVVVILLALVFLVIAGTLYLTVLAQAKSYLPPHMQDEMTLRFAIGTLIWKHVFPADLRRKYIFSIGSIALAFACISVAIYLQGYRIAAIVFGFASIYSGAYCLVQWRLYYDRL